jgi:putative FmdB family regulatory protein
MPVFSYKCTVCGHSFEKLVGQKDKDSVLCRCGSPTAREGIELFATKSTINPKDKVVYSGKEADLVIGADSAKRWTGHEERFRERTKDMVEIDTGIKPGEKFNPETILGPKSSRDNGAVYEKAVKAGDPALKNEWLDNMDPAKAGMRKVK